MPGEQCTINRAADQTWIFDPVTISGGGATVYIDNPAEAARCNADPDAYAAEVLGLASKQQYYEWLSTRVFALCGATNKKGKPCSNVVQGGNCDFDTEMWRRRHRHEPCSIHERETARSRQSSGRHLKLIATRSQYE